MGDHYLIIGIEGTDKKYIAAIVTMNEDTLSRYETYYKNLYHEIIQKDSDFNCFTFNDKTTFFVELSDGYITDLVRFRHSKEKIVKIKRSTFKKVCNDAERIIQGYVHMCIYDDSIYWSFIEDFVEETINTVELSFDEIKKVLR